MLSHTCWNLKVHRYSNVYFRCVLGLWISPQNTIRYIFLIRGARSVSRMVRFQSGTIRFSSTQWYEDWIEYDLLGSRVYDGRTFFVVAILHSFECQSAVNVPIPSKICPCNKTRFSTYLGRFGLIQCTFT